MKTDQTPPTEGATPPVTATEAERLAHAEARLFDDSDDATHVMTRADKALPVVILRNPPFPKS